MRCLINTVVISGLVVRNSGRATGDYADVELVYNVDFPIDIEDIRYWFRSRNIRTAPVKIYDGNRKLQWFVGIDNERRGDAPGKIYNRVGFSKKLEKDIKQLEWTTPANRRIR